MPPKGVHGIAEPARRLCKRVGSAGRRRREKRRLGWCSRHSGASGQSVKTADEKCKVCVADNPVETAQSRKQAGRGEERKASKITTDIGKRGKERKKHGRQRGR